MQQLIEETDALLAERVIDAALAVTRMVRAEVRRHEPGGLSASQVGTLAFLDWRAGASLAEVAEHLGLGAPAASRLVDELVRRGLIARAAVAADRRRIALRLLAPGKRALASARAVGRGPLQERLSALSEEEKTQLSDAVTSLRRLMGVATEPEVDGGARD